MTDAQGALDTYPAAWVTAEGATADRLDRPP